MKYSSTMIDKPARIGRSIEGLNRHNENVAVQDDADFSGNNFSEVKEYFKKGKFDSHNDKARLYEWSIFTDKTTKQLVSNYYETVQRYIVDMDVIPKECEENLKKNFIIVMLCGDGNCVLVHKSNKVYLFDHECANKTKTYINRLSKYKSFKSFAEAYEKYDSSDYSSEDLVYGSAVEYDDIAKSVTDKTAS